MKFFVKHNNKKSQKEYEVRKSGIFRLEVREVQSKFFKTGTFPAKRRSLAASCFGIPFTAASASPILPPRYKSTALVNAA